MFPEKVKKIVKCEEGFRFYGPGSRVTIKRIDLSQIHIQIPPLPLITYVT